MRSSGGLKIKAREKSLRTERDETIDAPSFFALTIISIRIYPSDRFGARCCWRGRDGTILSVWSEREGSKKASNTRRFGFWVYFIFDFRIELPLARIDALVIFLLLVRVAQERKKVWKKSKARRKDFPERLGKRRREKSDIFIRKDNILLFSSENILRNNKSHSSRRRRRVNTQKVNQSEICCLRK